METDDFKVITGYIFSFFKVRHEKLLNFSTFLFGNMRPLAYSLAKAWNAYLQIKSD